MYDLTPRAGAARRIAARDARSTASRRGSFSGNPDQYVADLLSSIAKGKTVTNVREHKGRYIAIVNAPLPGRRLGGDARGHHRARAAPTGSASR